MIAHNLRERANLKYINLVDALRIDENGNKMLYSKIKSLNINDLTRASPLACDMSDYIHAIVLKLHFLTSHLIDNGLVPEIEPMTLYCRDQGILLKHLVYHVRKYIESCCFALVTVYKGISTLSHEKDSYAAKSNSLAAVLKSLCTPQDLMDENSSSSNYKKIPTADEMIYELLARFGVTEAEIFSIFAKESWGVKRGYTVKVVKDTTPFDIASCDKYYDYSSNDNIDKSSNEEVADEIKADHETVLSDKDQALMKIREIVKDNGSNASLDEAVKGYNEAVVYEEAIRLENERIAESIDKHINKPKELIETEKFHDDNNRYLLEFRDLFKSAREEGLRLRNDLASALQLAEARRKEDIKTNFIEKTFGTIEGIHSLIDSLAFSFSHLFTRFSCDN